MNTAHAPRRVFGILAVIMLAVTGLSGQARAEAPQDAVLAELRALRAELNERLEASIRAQLLVARLQLQEQRINTVISQLRQVDDKIRENRDARASAEAGLKMFGLDKMDASDEKEGANFFFSHLKAQLGNLDELDAGMKLQQAELSAQLAQEQARWTAFSARLDELEAMLTTTSRR